MKTMREIRAACSIRSYDQSPVISIAVAMSASPGVEGNIEAGFVLLAHARDAAEEGRADGVRHLGGT